MLVPLALLAVGILTIYLGARWLVEGASELAAHFGIPPIVIGLTIVGLGTSAPELMLAVVSGVGGASSISVGNVMGSNIANTTYILGVCAIATPLLVRLREIRREALFMLLAMISLVVLSVDGSISWPEGLFLLVIFFLYLILLVRSLYCCRPVKLVEEEFEAARPEVEPPLKSAAFVIVGLGVLILGTELAVRSATEIAVTLGVSEFLIGLTIITFGTTTPEFATSFIASLKGRSDLAVGNIIGTLVFNTTLVLGTGALIAPLVISEDQLFLGVIPQLLFGLIVLGVAFRREYLKRPTGAVLVFLYVAYISIVLLVSA